ncbi:unnamed protein product, partial [Scytosiphon promiscuus]
TQWTSASVNEALATLRAQRVTEHALAISSWSSCCAVLYISGPAETLANPAISIAFALEIFKQKLVHDCYRKMMFLTSLPAVSIGLFLRWKCRRGSPPKTRHAG